MALQRGIQMPNRSARIVDYRMQLTNEPLRNSYSDAIVGLSSIP